LNRYSQLIPIIRAAKPKTIVEVGTWNGLRAIMMAQEALKHQKEVHYTGFDLFEDADEKTDARELNVKKHFTKADVTKALKQFQKDSPGFTFQLVKGDTRKTLKPQHSVDLAFIDGGHSVETIASDYEALKNAKVIVFDDWYEKDRDGKGPDTEKYGCNKLLSTIPERQILSAIDPVKDGGFVKMAALRLPQGSGEQNIVVQTKNCVPDESIQENIRHSVALNLRTLPICRHHDLRAVIASAGPSLYSYLPKVKQLQEKGARIVCVKHAHDLLIEKGIIPWACVLLDPRGHVQDFIENPHPEVNYFVASMCHPSTFDRLREKNAKVWLYHAGVGAGEDKLIGELVKDRASFLIGGGPASAIRAIDLLSHLGFRKFDLFGFDACYPVKPDLKDLDENGRPKYIEVRQGKRIFWTDYEKLAEVQFFSSGLMPRMGGMDIAVHGDGMIKNIHTILTKWRDTDFQTVFP
jgi:predicted O-methyltransferase YrrM